jgi:hypothetical protein
VSVVDTFLGGHPDARLVYNKVEATMHPQLRVWTLVEVDAQSILRTYSTEDDVCLWCPVGKTGAGLGKPEGKNKDRKIEKEEQRESATVQQRNSKSGRTLQAILSKSSLCSIKLPGL